MPLELTLVGIVLASALIHAVWNALVKTGGDEALMMALMTAVTGLIALVGVTLTETPAVQSWPFIAASVVIHAAYIVLLVKSYQSGELGHVYPLARGAAPLLVALGAFAFAAERITPVGGLGVLLISAGVMSLALAGGSRRVDGRRPAAFGLLTGVSIAAYTVVDGLGIRASGTPLGYIAWLFFLEAPPIVLWVAMTRRRAFTAYVQHHLPRGILIGGMGISSYGLALYALSQGAMAPVAALRETSSIFAVLIGTFLLRESFGRLRLIASALVAAGVVALNWVV